MRHARTRGVYDPTDQLIIDQNVIELATNSKILLRPIGRLLECAQWIKPHLCLYYAVI